MAGEEVWCAGRPLTTIAGWGELEWSHAADGGCKAASWQMALPLTYTHPALMRGSLVQIKCGPANLWAGLLTEPDVDDNWTFHAVGLSELGRGDYLAEDAAGNTTSKPDTAIDQAIARGLPWTRPASLSNAAFAGTDPTDGINYVGALLDAWADSVGKRWGVNADGQVYAVADPTIPTWYLTPDSGRMGLADDEYASDLHVRYLASGGYATTIVGDANAVRTLGRREFPVNATSLGLITSTQAAIVGNALLAKGKARMGYTNGVEVSKYQLTTPGGTPAPLSFVKAGDLVRMFGVTNEQGQPLPFLDWVIGETQYTAGSDAISLTPVGLVSRTLGDALTVAATPFSSKIFA